MFAGSVLTDADRTTHVVSSVSFFVPAKGAISSRAEPCDPSEKEMRFARDTAASRTVLSLFNRSAVQNDRMDAVPREPLRSGLA